MAARSRYSVAWPNWLVPAWWKYAYLIIPFPWSEELGKVININPTEEFKEFVAATINEYVKEGKKPADEIAPAILNLADDFVAGNPMTIRAGDYVSLQTHFQKMQKPVRK